MLQSSPPDTIYILSCELTSSGPRFVASIEFTNPS